MTSWRRASTSPCCSRSCLSAAAAAGGSGPTPWIARCSASRTKDAVSSGASCGSRGATCLPAAAVMLVLDAHGSILRTVACGRYASAPCPVEPPRRAGRSATRAATTRVDDLVGDRRRPGAGDAAGGVPARALPDAVGHAAATRCTGSARCAAACCRSTGWSCRGRCGGRCGDFEIRVDTAFAEVVAALRRPAPAAGLDRRRHPRRRTSGCTSWAGRTRSRPGGTGGWSAGCTASAIGGLFAGESMFHRERDASKVALVALVELLRDEHAERPAARRAVADAAPGVPRRGRGRREDVPAALGCSARRSASPSPRAVRGPDGATPTMGVARDQGWHGATTTQRLHGGTQHRAARAGRSPLARHAVGSSSAAAATAARRLRRTTPRRRRASAAPFNGLSSRPADRRHPGDTPRRSRALKDVAPPTSRTSAPPSDMPDDARHGFEVFVDAAPGDRRRRHARGPRRTSARDRQARTDAGRDRARGVHSTEALPTTCPADRAARAAAVRACSDDLGRLAGLADHRPAGRRPSRASRRRG